MLKEQCVLQKHWNITIPWLSSRKCEILFIWFEFIVLYLNFTPISLILNDIGSKGAVSLAEALKSNGTLTVLKSVFCFFDDIVFEFHFY